MDFKLKCQSDELKVTIIVHNAILLKTAKKLYSRRQNWIRIIKPNLYFRLGFLVQLNYRLGADRNAKNLQFELNSLILIIFEFSLLCFCFRQRVRIAPIVDGAVPFITILHSSCVCMRKILNEL